MAREALVRTNAEEVAIRTSVHEQQIVSVSLIERTSLRVDVLEEAVVVTSADREVI